MMYVGCRMAARPGWHENRRPADGPTRSSHQTPSIQTAALAACLLSAVVTARSEPLGDWQREFGQPIEWAISVELRDSGLLLAATEDGQVHVLSADDGGEAAGSPILTSPGVRVADAPLRGSDLVSTAESVAVLLHDRYRLWMLEACTGGVSLTWTVGAVLPPAAGQATATHDPENLPPLPAIAWNAERVDAFREDGTLAARRTRDGTLHFTGILAAVSGAAAFAGERSTYLGGLRSGGYDIWELEVCCGEPQTRRLQRVLPTPPSWVARTRAALLLASGDHVSIVQDGGVIRLTAPAAFYWRALGVTSAGRPNESATAGDCDLLILGQPPGRLLAVRVSDGTTAWAVDTTESLGDPHRLRLAAIPAAPAPTAARDRLIALHNDDQLAVMDAATGEIRGIHRWADRRILEAGLDGEGIDVLLASIARTQSVRQAELHRVSETANGAAGSQRIQMVDLPEGYHSARWRPRHVILIGRTRVHAAVRPAP